MTALLLSVGSALAVWACMAVLSFQSSSQRRRLGLPEHTGRERWRFILAGAVLIVLSLAAAIAADGVQFGIVLWLCQVGMLGVALICCLPFARTAVTASAWAAALLAPLLLASATWM